MIASLSLLLAASQTSGSSPFPMEWVVKEVIAPPVSDPGTSGDVGVAGGLGSPDGSVLPYFAFVRRGTILGSPQSILAAGNGLLVDRFREVTGGYVGNPITLGQAGSDGAALLQTPSGLRLVATNQLQSYWPTLWSLCPLVPIGTVSIGDRPDYLQRAGDLNADGYDDFFYTGRDPVANLDTYGAVDGATLLPLWAKTRIPTSGVLPDNIFVERGDPEDVDGDGVPDLIAGWQIASVTQPIQEQLVEAYSGVDGSTIWSSNLGLQQSFATTVTHGADLSGDGLGDVLVSGGDGYRAADGADGSLLWELTNAAFSSYVPNAVNLSSWGAQGVSARPGIPGARSAFFTLYYYDPVAASLANAIAHVDSMSGQVVHFDFLPENLEPWLPDMMHGGNMREFFMVGDLDNDGMKELAVRVLTPSNTSLGAPSPNISMAILGQKTLDVPATASLGTTVDIDVAIPTAAGRPFRVLVSDGFDADGGRRIHGWRTHLAAGAVLTATSTNPALFGTLGPDGRGAVQASLPQSPAWIGTTLYLKAVVRGASWADEPFSMSSLGTLEIVL